MDYNNINWILIEKKVLMEVEDNLVELIEKIEKECYLKQCDCLAFIGAISCSTRYKNLLHLVNISQHTTNCIPDDFKELL